MARSTNWLRFALQGARRLAGRRIRPPRRKFEVVEPRAIERDYLSAILPILKRVHAQVVARMIPRLGELAYQARGDARLDGYVDVIADIIDGIERELAEDGDRGLYRIVEAIAHQVDGHNLRQTAANIKHLTGIDVPAFVPGLEDKLSAFSRQNVQLIRSIPADYLYDVEQTVLRAFREGKRAEEIAGMLEDRLDVAQNRAALIARDQVGKLNGELFKERQTGLGLWRYRWRTAGDDRVRPDHRDRDGEIMEWDNPPEDGHPGMPIQCRCWPEPLVEDLLGE